jgi:hypothetical protein
MPKRVQGVEQTAIPPIKNVIIRGPQALGVFRGSFDN